MQGVTILVYAANTLSLQQQTTSCRCVSLCPGPGLGV